MSARTVWLRSFLAAYRRPVAVALALGVVASAFSALLMFTSGYLISATAVPDMTLFAVMTPVAFVQVFGIGRPLARYLERLVSHDWVLRVTSDLRRALFRHVASNAADPAEQRSSGEYLGLLSDDIAHLQNLYLRVVFPSAIALVLAVLASVLFGFFSPFLALSMALAFLGTVVVLPAGTLAATRVRHTLAKDLRSKHYDRVTDDVLGSTDWMLAGRADDAMGSDLQRGREVRVVEAKLRAYDRAMELASTLVLAAALFALIAWAGGNLTTTYSQSNWIAALALGFFPLMESFAVLPGLVASSTDYLQSVDRLKGVVEADAPATGLEPLVLEGKGSTGASLEFVDVTYAYPDAGTPALRGASLRVEAGESVAILGRSGSGKSTLASVARGLLAPQEGTLLIGGREVPARAYDLSRTVGFLSQDPYLFDKSLRDNLALAAPGVSDARLIELLYRVGLGERFESLPRGLDTMVGETGTGFSGGEAHRLALVRVLAADVPVVVVDEPFAALDPSTERDLLDTLLDACAGRTLVVITHHLAQIDRFDRVVFLEDGRVELEGSPADLQQASERFRQLAAFDRGLFQR